LPRDCHCVLLSEVKAVTPDGDRHMSCFVYYCIQ
jgi:hypothetical protein